MFNNQSQQQFFHNNNSTTTETPTNNTNLPTNANRTILPNIRNNDLLNSHQIIPTKNKLEESSAEEDLFELGETPKTTNTEAMKFIY